MTSQTKAFVVFGNKALRPGFQFGGPFLTRDEAKARVNQTFTGDPKKEIDKSFHEVRLIKKSEGFYWTVIPAKARAMRTSRPFRATRKL